MGQGRGQPGVEIGGCYFHFVHNLWKCIQKSYLGQAYNQDPLLHISPIVVLLTYIFKMVNLGE